ncbi:hypothetical protein DFP73DRAFT_532756 [Morchella snyderi]|nr:hypothetical protein DFP73DRAFT_532756 [Morchella snyderi]
MCVWHVPTLFSFFPFFLLVRWDHIMGGGGGGCGFILFCYLHHANLLERASWACRCFDLHQVWVGTDMYVGTWLLKVPAPPVPGSGWLIVTGISGVIRYRDPA